jgi:putative NIF3 family GTP cyclohydrolase 1 type 2
MNTTRRSLILTAAAAAAARAQDAGLTAADVIARIRKQVGVPWREQTVDTIKSGAPGTPVKGIATTMMATLDVVQRAAAAGRNMVITHEPTFYSHEDQTADLREDPVYRFKQSLLNRHDMVVFRFHDHWHARRPDGIAAGMARALGWEKNADAQNPRQFRFESATLGSLAGQLASKLNIRTMRVIGDPALPVRTLAANWGYNSTLRTFARPDIDALVIGEAREWELIEYAADAVTSGSRKGLIVLGHIPSEQSGMQLCAEWLKGFIPEVPVEFIPAAEPFWRP